MIGLILLLVGILGAVAYYVLKSATTKKKPTKSQSDVNTTPSAPKQKVAKIDITKRKNATGSVDPSSPSPSPSYSSSSSSQRKASEAEGDHSLIARHLRGHQAEITGIAIGSSGSLVASVSKDESLRLWSIDDSQANTHFARVNLKKGTHATAVAMTNDEQFVVIAIAESRQIQVYSIGRDDKKHGTLTLRSTFATPHKANITSLRIGNEGRVVVSLAEGSTDLSVHLFSITGTLITSISVAQLVNYTLALSNDSTFLTFGTKISDVKVYELIYPKGANSNAPPQSVRHLLTLNGHRRGIRSLGFSTNESGLLVSGSIDGAFCEHSLKDRRGVRQEATLKSRTQTQFTELSLIDISASDESTSQTIALTNGTHLQFWRTSTVITGNAEQDQPTLLTSIPTAHKLTYLAFNKNTPAGKEFLFTAGENKSITVWKAPH